MAGDISFLSIGGRFVLTKSVLESLPVYWLSLTWIPRSILKQIQSRMARFIWSGCKEKSSISLAKWSYLTKPKALGGWGLKDLANFGLALTAKNMWRCLFVPCLWNRVVQAKYLHGWGTADWLRMESIEQLDISNIWRALLKALPILKSWLAWKPGDGWSIRIGRDPIVGMAGILKLSEVLLDHLLHRRIYYLAQAAKIGSGDNFTCWANAQDLGLDGDAGREWNNYIYGLKNLGICLKLIKDTLCWSKNIKDGTITAALAYKTTSRQGNSDLIPEWFSKVWKWGLPLKITLFSWLMIANCILT